MKVLAVIGHQRKGSFCHAILAAAVEELRAAGHEVVVHDLYEEEFDPVLPSAEVPKGAVLPPVVQAHVDDVTRSDGYIIVHPNWWGAPPAILKGWLDRVIRQGVGYDFGPEGGIGLLQGKRALVLTTSNTPRDAEIALYGDPLENFWKKVVFGLCGLSDCVRRNFESIVMSTPEQRAGWLAETRQLVQKQFPAAR